MSIKLGMMGMAVLLVFGLISPAHAYLDPATGGMIVQIVIGAIAGALVTLKLYWYRIKMFFSGKKPSEDEDN